MKPRALFALPPAMYEVIYAGYPRERLDSLVNVIGEPVTADSILSFPRLAEVECLFMGWGSPRLEEKLLAAMPNLRAVFYGAGSIRSIVSEAFWARGRPITSAYAANAIPVAEFAHAAILLSLKRVWYYMRAAREEKRWPNYVNMPGAYRSTVGLVSLGAIGRLVAERLRSSEIEVVAYDPYVTAATAHDVGAGLVDLAHLFRVSDVVSLHAPLLQATEGLIDGTLLRSMKPHATLLNTARGGLIKEDDLVATLRERPDLTAVLDVTHPEPPVSGSPLYELPNLFLTPHVAGSMDAECKRMGSLMAEEVERLLAGQPLQWQITRAQFERMA